MNDKYSRFCKNCEYWKKGYCILNEKLSIGNIVTDCEDFKGELQLVQWSKSHTVGYRSSTFSRDK